MVGIDDCWKISDAYVCLFVIQHVKEADFAATFFLRSDENGEQNEEIIST